MAAAGFAAYAGYAGWGFWATFAAVAVGTAIDMYLFAPAGNQFEGPRLNDMRVITSTYGNPIPIVYGPENRVSGNVIWSTGLLETKKEEESGGKGGGESESTTYSYRMSLAVAISGRPCLSIKRVWANNKLIREADGDFHVMSSFTFYPGSSTQTPDPTIESYLGVGLTPAYRHTCYVVIKDLQLADFGNRMPNIEFEVEADTSISVGGAVADICSRAGVENVSCAHLTENLRGYVLSRSGPAIGALAPLGTAFSFDIAEQTGDLRFVLKGRSLKGVIPLDHMGAAQPGQNAREPIKHSVGSDLGLPKQVNVTHNDPSLDYQTNTQRAFREFGNASNIGNVELPMTLSIEQAARIADRILWEAWTSRKTASFKTDDVWVRRNAGDLLGIPTAGEILPHKLTRMTRGNDGILDIEASAEDPLVYASEVTGTPGNVPANVLRVPGVTRFQPMDMPLLRNADDSTGFYWAVTAASTGWRGAQIRRSSDGGTNYSIMSGVSVRSVIGDVAAALPSGPADFWDRGNSITVVLAYTDDTLESISEESVLNGNNVIWLGPSTGQGGELIQFATATLVAPSTYVLTDLLRGRLGTEAEIGGHGINETMVLLNFSFLGRSDYGPGDWDQSRLYKPVSLLTEIDDTTAQSFTNTGAMRKPLSPIHIHGTRDGSNNLTVDFIRRTRYRVPGLGKGPVPLGEETEAYEIDIYDGVTVVRTITATTTTFSYTAAEQTADGLTPGDLVDMIIYQMSADRGRGFPGSATV